MCGHQILRTFNQTITWSGDWLEFDESARDLPVDFWGCGC